MNHKIKLPKLISDKEIQIFFKKKKNKFTVR